MNSRVFWLGRETLLQVVLPVHLLLFGLMKSHRAEYLFFMFPPPPMRLAVKVHSITGGGS